MAFVRELPIRESMATTNRMPVFEPLDPRLRDLYRAASPTQKLAVVHRLNATLIGLKEAELQARHAEMTPHQRRELLRHWWLTARD